MAAPTYTLATVSKNPDGTYTLGNRPASAYSLATASAGGGRPPLPYTNFDGAGATPGVDLDDTVSLSVLQALPTTGDVRANFQYACSSDLWNNAAGGTVWVLGLKPDAYWPVGVGTVNGKRQLVTIDVAAATYVPFAAGVVGTPRDPFAVGDVLSIADAVADPSNTWRDGDLIAFGSTGLQDAGAPPAVAGQNNTILVGTADVSTMDEFDRLDSGGAGGWRYRYSRRNDGTSGWTRIPKG